LAEFEIVDSVFLNSNKRVERQTVDSQVLEVFEHENAVFTADPDAFLERIHRDTRPSGNRLHDSALIIKEPGDSPTYCVASQPPFPAALLPKEGNPNSYNIPVKAYFVDRINRARGLLAPDGKPMSTLIGSAPDRDHWPMFSLTNRLKIFRGDFIPHAKRLINVMKTWGYEGGYFFGVSRGAVVGAAALAAANRENIDSLGAVLISPINFKNEAFFMPAVNFARDFKPGTKPKDLSGHWWDDGPEVMLHLQKKYGDGSYIGNYLTTNVFSSGIGYSQGKFGENIKTAGRHNIPVAIGCGERNAMTDGLIEALQNDAETLQIAGRGLIKVFVAHGPASGHGFTENQLAYNAIISEGFGFLQEAK